MSFLTADLASQAQVRALAQEFEDRFERLDVLINNAGVDAGKRVTTPDGLELTFVVNYLARFLLTHLLLPKLKASAPSRVLNVASSAHHGGQIDFDDLQCERRFGQPRTTTPSWPWCCSHTSWLAVSRAPGSPPTASTLDS